VHPLIPLVKGNREVGKEVTATDDWLPSHFHELQILEGNGNSLELYPEAFIRPLPCRKLFSAHSPGFRSDCVTSS
jgi:hypothetical protein